MIPIAPSSLVRMAAIFFAAAGLLTWPQLLMAQAPVSTEADPVRIEGPPPPTAPEVANWDDEGRATVRAVRVSGLRIDGELDEAFYETTPSISDFIQTVPDEGAAPTERTDRWSQLLNRGFVIKVNRLLRW